MLLLNHQGEVLVKDSMQLTSYLWKKNWNAMEKLWKSYEFFFLGICTNPEGGSVLGEAVLNDVGQCNHGGVAGCGKADIVPGNRLDHLCGS